MQIVIDIDERRFKDILRISTVQLKGRTPTLEQVIANGTPLPKGHGRLIDADALNFADIDSANYGSNYIRIAPTIIEADVPDTNAGKKAGEEE